MEHDRAPSEVCRAYKEHGYAVLPGFYDVETDINPIRAGIAHIIKRVADKHGIAIGAADDPLEIMTKGYRAIIDKDRRLGGEIYDAVKQIPAFLKLVSDPRNTSLYNLVGGNDVEPGIAAGGYGIRIDNPGEEKFRAQWHQEFPAQLRSLDGIVFWTPLLDVTREMGPVQVLPASHHEGLLKVFDDAGGANKTGAYALHLEREKEIVARYPAEAPLLKAGDLLVMNFLTVHQSGFNTSPTPRWTMQFRYFNFADPVGVRLSWKGSFAAGQDFRSLLSEVGVDG